MTVLLLLYLCEDATRIDCQVVPARLWQGPDAYELCIATVPGLTQALTAPNRERHRFVCEIQTDGEQNAGHHAKPTFIHRTFRM